jgi:GNAT superfamily N-acetyltransferase
VIIVKDIGEGNIEDIFKVCSHSRLDDPLQRTGMEMKRAWLLRMLEEHGPCTKIAYLDGRPVAQILFYPEEAVPFIPDPREGAVVLNCAYNPFPEARGKGAGSSLVRNLAEEAGAGLKCLRGEPCSIISAKPFETGEGLSMTEFYSRCGFSRADSEMYLEILGEYRPKGEMAYEPLEEDGGKVIMFYDPICEWGYGFAVRVRDLIHEIEPGYPFEMIDPWERPGESARRGNRQLIVNGHVIQSFWMNRKAFRREVEEAIRG